MKTLRPLILCGCTSDTANSCALKSWVGRACLCPCHYTNEQTKRLVSAYVHAGEGQVAGFIKNLVAKTEKVAKTEHSVMAACGHEKHFEQKPSQMAALYIKQHPCDQCSQEP